MLTPEREDVRLAKMAVEMLSKGQVLNADHPLVVIDDALDRLSAKVAALKEAGDGLAAFVEGEYSTPEDVVARWREVRGE